MLVDEDQQLVLLAREHRIASVRGRPLPRRGNKGATESGCSTKVLRVGSNGFPQGWYSNSKITQRDDLHRRAGGQGGGPRGAQDQRLRPGQDLEHGAVLQREGGGDGLAVGAGGKRRP